MNDLLYVFAKPRMQRIFTLDLNRFAKESLLQHDAIKQVSETNHNIKRAYQDRKQTWNVSAYRSLGARSIE
jgi:hypothetical protein